MTIQDINAGVSVLPLSAALGAEIRGVDVTHESMDFDAILATWHEYLVILFRNQNLSPDDQVRFARRFGAIEPRGKPRSAEQQSADLKKTGHPDLMLVSNIRENGQPIGSLPDGEMEFHADSCYREFPTRGAFLYAMEVPSAGGDTMFLNLYKAYETLPDSLKRKIGGRKAVNVYSYGVMRRDENESELDGATRFSHPIVRTHPETGRKALFINRLMTRNIEGMDKIESRDLLDQLIAHIEQPQFIYTHRWRPGDLLLWDNRCTLHARTDFSSGERRLLRRIALAGDTPHE
jgi:taurine dioxygenase